MTEPQSEPQPSVPEDTPPYPETTYQSSMPPAPVVNYRGPAPGQVIAAGVLLIVFGALSVLLTFVLLAGANQAESNGETISGVVFALLYGQLVFSAVQIISGALTLRGFEWARVLSIVISSLNLLGGVIMLFTGSAIALIGIIVNILIIALISRRDVVDWFRDGV